MHYIKHNMIATTINIKSNRRNAKKVLSSLYSMWTADVTTEGFFPKKNEHYKP